MAASGYLHPRYTHSLAEFGVPRELPASGGWILEREIPGSSRRDAMGPYPVFVCRDWSGLCADVEGLNSELVSLVLVTDPLAKVNFDALRRCFDDVRPFKDQFVVDLRRAREGHGSRHHRYYARRALRLGIEVERCDSPADLLDEWVRLYEVLAARHELRGIKRFSREAFEVQLSVPGAIMFRAVKDNVAVAAQLWYVQGEAAYSHLQASSPAGYQVRAAYALYSEAFRWLATRCSVAMLGAGAGPPGRDRDGLTQFKRGWATDTRRSHLCTRVFDRWAYEQLVHADPSASSDYFPAYRSGELV